MIVGLCCLSWGEEGEGDWGEGVFAVWASLWNERLCSPGEGLSMGKWVWEVIGRQSAFPGAPEVMLPPPHGAALGKVLAVP